jgi:hypothetical protein
LEEGSLKKRFYVITFLVLGILTMGLTTGIVSASTYYSDDFSADSGLWDYVGTAYRDSTNHNLVITESTYNAAGAVFFKTPITSNFVANFSYLVGRGSGADGFTLFFYKQYYTDVGYGGNLGFNKVGVPIPGYGVEFDGWQNTERPPSPPGEHADPSAGHVALIKDFVGNHLTYVNDARVRDNAWHSVSVIINDSSLKVILDEQLVLQWTGTFDKSYSYFGFSAATGAATNWHIIDDVSIELTNPVLFPVPESSIGTLGTIIAPILAVLFFRGKPLHKLGKPFQSK